MIFSRSQDVQLLVEAMGFDENNMTSCVGVTAPTPPPGMSHVTIKQKEDTY